MSIRVTQKSYKVSTSRPRAFSSCSYRSISSSAFSLVGSSSGSFRGGLNSSMSVVGGYGGPGTVSVNQSLLCLLKLEVDPNIQAVHTQEKEQIKSLNKFASFIDKVRHLEQQNKIQETKWGLLQQQKIARSNIDNMFESYINNLRRQLDTLGQEKLKLEVELGNLQGLIKLRGDMENEFVLIKKDVDEAYMHKIELESRLEGLTGEINSLRQLYEEETHDLPSQISDPSAVLSTGHSRSLDLDGVIAEVKAQYEDIANCSRAEAQTMHQFMYEELQTLAGKHGDDLRRTKTEISEMNWSISRLQAEIETLKNQRAAPEPAIADAEQRGEPAIRDANAKVAEPEPEATLQRDKQDMARQLREYRELLNPPESGMQNTSIRTKTTSGYSGGLNLAYGGLTSPGPNYGQSPFQSGFGPGDSFSRSSSSKAVVVKKIETRDGKLVSESSDVLLK
ncbi:unnamed protein product [Nyctereutes procyonoides]|uniref:Keratin, type II cytoskeletal 8 n=1 Tax=Nyctereutes procyonoides TaxID=34880 RepID=A0A811Y7N1_NYCPR|nr:unnamed protein product [Nyctereutes procyonoides]